MQYTVNTGLLVAFVLHPVHDRATDTHLSSRIDAAAGLFTYICMPHNLIFLGEGYPLISVVLIAISSLAGFYLLLSKREIDTVKKKTLVDVLIFHQCT